MKTNTTTAAATDLKEIERIQQMGEKDLDQLPFGAIRLDQNGKILFRYTSRALITPGGTTVETAATSDGKGISELPTARRRSQVLLPRMAG